MGIKNLPGGGIGFRVSTGAGNLTKKMNVAVMHDAELKNLADNTGSILKVVKKYEGAIRIHKFDRLRRLAAYRQIKKLEGANLSYADKKDVKNLLKHFSGALEKVNTKKKISTINRAEDPNSLTKGGILRLPSLNRDPENNRINTRSLDTNISLDINKRNSQDIRNNRISQINSNSLDVKAGDNPVDYRVARLANKERINPRSFNVQSNDDKINSQSANIEKAESLVVSQPTNIQMSDNKINSRSFDARNENLPTSSSLNIQKSDEDYRALGLIKRKRINSRSFSVQSNDDQIISQHGNIQRTEIPVTPKPAINIEKDEVPVAPLFTPEPPKMERKESPVIPQSIKVEKKEKKITPEPIKVEKKEVKKEEIPVTPESVKAEKKESQVSTESSTVKNIEAKKVEIKKEETKKEETKKEETKKEETKKEETKKEETKKEETKKEETPITNPIIYIRRAENPIAPEPAKSKKKKKPIVPQFANPINFEKKINIQKAETPINKDTPNIADLKEPAPDNIAPSKEEVRTNRGDAVRAKINYEHALNLGGSEAARDIQKKAFEKMNNSETAQEIQKDSFKEMDNNDADQEIPKESFEKMNSIDDLLNK